MVLIVHLVACFWHLIVRNDLMWMPIKDLENLKTDVHNSTLKMSPYFTELYTSAMMLVGINMAPLSTF